MGGWSIAGADRDDGQTRPGRFRPGRWGWWLILVGGAALLSMTELGHVAAILALVSVIGIPLYFILALLPAAFLFLLFLRFVLGAIGNLRAGALLRAAGFGALALLMVDHFVLRAFRENARLDARAQALVAADIDGQARIPAGRTLAIVRSERFPGRATPEDLCDDLCQRVLLNGFAKRVLVATLVPTNVKGAPPVLPALEPSPAISGALYWLEQRPACPETKVPDSLMLVQVDAPVPGAGRMATRAASEAMRVKIASGTCLVSEAARLDQADGAFFYGQVARGSGLAYGFDVSKDTVEAWRVAYFTRDGADWTAQRRDTGVRYQRFPGALIPTYINGQQLQIHNGYLRSARVLGARKKHEGEPPVAETLTALGVNLRIDDAGQADAPKVIDEALASKAPLLSLQASIIDDYLGRLSANRRKHIEPDDVKRVLALAADPRVAFAWPAQGAMTMIAEQQPQLAPEVTRILFGRLDAVVAASGIAGEQATRAATSLSNALAAMPASALAPYFSNIEEVSRNAALRASAQNLIARLDVFGSFAVPAMFKVMDDSLAQRAPRKSSNWGAGFSAGLRALCRLGGEGAFARPMLEERIRAQGEFFVKANDRLVVVTLLRMGASEPAIRDLLGIDEKNENRMRYALRVANGPRPCE